VLCVCFVFFAVKKKNHKGREGYTKVTEKVLKIKNLVFFVSALCSLPTAGRFAVKKKNHEGREGYTKDAEQVLIKKTLFSLWPGDFVQGFRQV